MTAYPLTVPSRASARIIGAVLGFVLTPIALWLLATGAAGTYSVLLESYELFNERIIPALLLVLLGGLLFAGVCWLSKLTSLAPTLATLWLLLPMASMFTPAIYGFLNPWTRQFMPYAVSDFLFTGSAGPLGIVTALLCVTTALLRRSKVRTGTPLTVAAAILGTLLVLGGFYVMNLAVTEYRLELVRYMWLDPLSSFTALLMTISIVLIGLGFICALRSSSVLFFSGGALILLVIFYVISALMNVSLSSSIITLEMERTLTYQTYSGILFSLGLAVIAGGIAQWQLRNQILRSQSVIPVGPSSYHPHTTLLNGQPLNNDQNRGPTSYSNS
ncbi:hypothetical protein [Psychromicrobium sp. YIM B11713]|uniref:hypothetical protein n=1 Tax=Psychromicrobium sp. YIM B11713 TaxID=3145233 RepID=UPI00374F523A